MCGIAGAVWNDAGKAVEPATLQRMIDVLRHRGPDDEGTHWDVPSPDQPSAGARKGAGGEGIITTSQPEALTLALSQGERGLELGTSGIMSQCGVALGHRRLAIIDVAGGKQPLVQRGRLRVGRLQRRNLQLPRPAPPARRGRATASARKATPKCSSISTRTKGPSSSTHSTACSPWPSGTPGGGSCCWPATGWARSRWSIATSRAGCCSPAS